MILDVRGTAKNKQTNKQTWDGGSRSNVFPRCRCSVIKAEKSRSSFLCESERPWQTDAAAAAADDDDDRDEEEVEDEQGHVPQQKKISPSRGGSGRCWESGGRQAKSQLQKTLLALCLQPSGAKFHKWVWVWRLPLSADGWAPTSMALVSLLHTSVAG